jgi:predicted Zn-dependent protease
LKRKRRSASNWPTSSFDNPVVQKYLDRLGQRLAAQMPEASFPFTFTTVVDDPCTTTHEPFAPPGGYVFVPSGLFLAAQDETEFAGMLVHAMEHIAQRHGMRQAARDTIANGASIPLIFVASWTGACSDTYAIPLGFVASQRSAELEADVLAVQAMARAGFDPTALVRYIDRVQVRPAGAMSKAYSPVPDRGERMAALLATIEKLPKGNYAVASPDEFSAAQQEVRALSESPARRETPPSLLRKTSH